MYERQEDLGKVQNSPVRRKLSGQSISLTLLVGMNAMVTRFERRRRDTGAFREVHHDAEHGPIGSRTDSNWSHCSSFRVDECVATPRRANRPVTMSPSCAGSSRTSLAGTNIGSRDAELTRRRSGCRSTTNRLTYQSPSAVSELSTVRVMASEVQSFRVGPSITISVVFDIALVQWMSGMPVNL